MRTYLEADISAAAYLWCQGLAFLGCVDDPSRPGRLRFEFDDPEGIAGLAAREFVNGGTVCARDYAAALSRLKTQLYTSKGNGNGHFAGTRR